MEMVDSQSLRRWVKSHILLFLYQYRCYNYVCRLRSYMKIWLTYSLIRISVPCRFKLRERQGIYTDLLDSMEYIPTKITSYFRSIIIVKTELSIKSLFVFSHLTMIILFWTIILYKSSIKLQLHLLQEGW